MGNLCALERIIGNLPGIIGKLWGLKRTMANIGESK